MAEQQQVEPALPVDQPVDLPVDPPVDLRVEPDLDSELLALARTDGPAAEAAVAQLWVRHLPAVRRLARAVAGSVDPHEVDDLVSESFARVLAALRAGGGPRSALRPYWVSTLRRVAIDASRRRRPVLGADGAAPEPEPQPSAEHVVAEQEEAVAARRAWASLPEDSRVLLWELVVEGRSPAEVAPLLGVSANAVSSRGTRARERLREAFLSHRLGEPRTPACRVVRPLLGSFAREGLALRDRVRVETHLSGCLLCREAVAEARSTALLLRRALLPGALLPGLVPAALTGGGAGVGAGVGASGALGGAGVVGPAVAAVAAGLLAVSAGAPSSDVPHPSHRSAPPAAAGGAAARVADPVGAPGAGEASAPGAGGVTTPGRSWVRVPPGTRSVGVVVGSTGSGSTGGGVGRWHDASTRLPDLPTTGVGWGRGGVRAVDVAYGGSGWSTVGSDGDHGLAGPQDVGVPDEGSADERPPHGPGGSGPGSPGSPESPWSPGSPGRGRPALTAGTVSTPVPAAAPGHSAVAKGPTPPRPQPGHPERPGHPEHLEHPEHPEHPGPPAHAAPHPGTGGGPGHGPADPPGHGAPPGHHG
ncbi:sigma-70 family RNA polymerase sigma factor [Lapillicoccus jejuensis]|uniref:RNA polymerase sigma factor (Sigma-70 family) n=1 Tax=Lapillicoccus jejuensis TaxID=402171 RepID=A0A542DZ45_9MICO|nr:sigma-70 family RNA polymerase sigma factor [Lapillicoccus jejuensis]TQJ08204.1 RNA polymerase sigma factor (sigma-70 family) [Lapillicoccus jejuensis]